MRDPKTMQVSRPAALVAPATKSSTPSPFRSPAAERAFARRRVGKGVDDDALALGFNEIEAGAKPARVP